MDDAAGGKQPLAVATHQVLTGPGYVMNEEFIDAAMQQLARVDDDIAQAFGQYGKPAPRLRPEGFETLLSTIVSQQISTEVAKIIMGRVHELLPEISAQAVLKIEDKALRQAGLSFRKISYARGLAEAVTAGEFDADALKNMSNESAIQAITALRGFGRWSAEIYLMFSLQRQDVFPANDLALQVALARLKKLEEKPTAGQARELVAHWSPWRSVGSLFLWHYYRGAPA